MIHFENPNVLYFLPLLLIPVLVHLFQLRKFKKELFTNVKFLKKITSQTRKSSTIKKWLLLACRLLIVLFLILAFAQPYFGKEKIATKQSQLYLVLDNSNSMQAIGQKGELLARAIQEILENIPENQTFNLLTNTEDFWNTNRTEIQNSLQKLSFSPNAFELTSILNKINDHKTAFDKKVIIITDGLGITENELKAVDKNYQFVIPKAEKTQNCSIDSVYIKSEQGNLYQINVVISRYGNQPQKLNLSIGDATKNTIKAQIEMKENKQQFEFSIPKKAFSGQATIQDESLTYDNSYYFSISDTKKIKVLSIGENLKSNFISKIYTKDEFEYSNSEINQLNYSQLEQQDVVLINEIDNLPQALITTLQDFYSKGGTVIVIPSENCNTISYQTFLKSIANLSFGNKIETEEKITKINFKHPLFDHVFTSKVTNFQYPNTKNHYPISGNSSKILEYNGNQPFLASASNKLGFVYVFASAINKNNSNFQQSSLIVPTFYQMAKSNQNNSLKAYTIGNKAQMVLTTPMAKEAVIEVQNSKEKFIPIQQKQGQKVKLFFEDYPTTSGNYEITNQNKAIDRLSFNYQRTESNLSATYSALMSNYQVSNSFKEVVLNSTATLSQSNNWKWFVIFALLFLLIEMAIIRFLK